METEPVRHDAPGGPALSSSGGPGDSGDDLQAMGEAIGAVDTLLDEVEAALMRLDDGTYGCCAACGGPIDDPWLEQAPTVQNCRACTGSLVVDMSEADSTEAIMSITDSTEAIDGTDEAEAAIERGPAVALPVNPAGPPA